MVGHAEDEEFADEEFNIEGFANQDDEFLIGLRSPIVDGKAMVVPNRVFKLTCRVSPEYGDIGNNIEEMTTCAD